MTQDHPLSDRTREQDWLQRYYAVRAVFSVAWIIAVLVLAPRSSTYAAILLVCYPAWDALANLVDARRSGALDSNRIVLANAAASAVVAVGLAIALPDMHGVLAVFGAWAIAAGLLQLGTGLRRWKSPGAQWAMVLSGAQSALAGGFFLYQSQLAHPPSITSLVGYAGFGAFYFLVSALWLSVRAQRRKRA